MTTRIEEELELLRKYYPELEFHETGNWVRIPDFSIPQGHPWNREKTDVCFEIPQGYPGTHPYGIYVPVGIRCNGNKPNSYTEPAQKQPPFPGQWGVFSWSPDTPWKPTADILKGPNLLNFVHTFADRFREGC